MLVTDTEAVQALSLAAMSHFDPQTCSILRGKQGSYQLLEGKEAWGTLPP